MKLFISPAKKLDFKTRSPYQEHTIPHFSDEMVQLNRVLKTYSAEDLSKLMGISEKLAEENYHRNQGFSVPLELGTSKQAIFAFKGDVYIGLDSDSLSDAQVRRLQNSLWILSGLYGILKPLDLIYPYRLEMGTKLKVWGTRNLYEFWQKKLTAWVNKNLGKDELVVNLASDEYSKVLDLKSLKQKVIIPYFKDYKNGKLKTIQFYAKKARGMMVRHISTSSMPDLDHILRFSADGYQYSPSDSESEFGPVFIR